MATPNRLKAGISALLLLLVVVVTAPSFFTNIDSVGTDEFRNYTNTLDGGDYYTSDNITYQDGARLGNYATGVRYYYGGSNTTINSVTIELDERIQNKVGESVMVDGNQETLTGIAYYFEVDGPSSCYNGIDYSTEWNPTSGDYNSWTITNTPNNSTAVQGENATMLMRKDCPFFITASFTGNESSFIGVDVNNSPEYPVNITEDFSFTGGTDYSRNVYTDDIGLAEYTLDYEDYKEGTTPSWVVTLFYLLAGVFLVLFAYRAAVNNL